jgi:hypothetical protein
LRPTAGGIVSARLIPLARTPLGVVVGEGRQEAGIPLSGLFDWIERAFPSDDERAFVASVRDLELLARIGWETPFPESIDERSVVNVEDLPDDVADALADAAAPLVQCAACRRLCVRDDFVWKEKQLCAWDYHAQVFGRRGPWREGAYEERHFETLPRCAYVAPLLLAELGVEPVLTGVSLQEPTTQAIVNVILDAEPGRPHMAVRTEYGICVLREAPVPSANGG